MTSSHSDVCLVTVTTESYLPGTVAMLGSFLKHHPGFDGDIVIIERGLPGKRRRMLRTAFPRVRFASVSVELVERAQRLQAELPHPKIATVGHFSKLDAFRLSGYRKVLLCDGDILFRASISDLFDTGDALICCGDRMMARGWHRDAETMAPLRPGAGVGSGEGGAGVLEQPFNSGFLVVDGRLTGERVHADLLAMLAAEQWRRLSPKVLFGDQDILNRYFAGRQTLVSWTYNYLLPQVANIRAREGLDASEAKVLHYLGSLKPWIPGAMLLPWATGGRDSSMTNAFNLWYDTWMGFPASVRRPLNATVLVRTFIRKYSS